MKFMREKGVILKRNWKEFAVSLVVCGILLFVIWGGFSLFQRKMMEARIAGGTALSFVFQIDSVKIDRDRFILEGWYFKFGQDSDYRNLDIALYDMDNNKVIYPKKKNIKRNDVNQYFLCEYDYSKSGFCAIFKMSGMDFENNDYEILIEDKETGKTYNTLQRTGTYISKGKLVYTNPKEFISLDVVGTDLEEIIKNGILRVYRPDVGMYVYQYDKKLYWIADEKYNFSENQKTLLQINTETTQKDNLPEKSIALGASFGEEDIYFEECELTDIHSGLYRVAVKKIPETYSITGITSGDYDDYAEKWLWVQEFRIWYVFSN